MENLLTIPNDANIDSEMTTLTRKWMDNIQANMITVKVWLTYYAVRQKVCSRLMQNSWSFLISKNVVRRSKDVLKPINPVRNTLGVLKTQAANLLLVSCVFLFN